MEYFQKDAIDRILKSKSKSKDCNYYLDIPNKSHYIANDSKTHFRLINPSHFVAQQSRQFSYFVRLYYHYLHVKQLGGLCYFYTLTYNNAALPHFHGIRCFNHEHIQKFFRSSGFDKKLSRVYGFKLQYFVTCELGDGKGSRGFEGNPHYHIIFFLVPDGVQKEAFSSAIFQDLVRQYWCGKDYDKKHPWDYKYGIAMPGDNLGLVSSPAALRYASKYVLKDTVYRKLVDQLECKAKDIIALRLFSNRKACEIYHRYFGFEKYPLKNPEVKRVINRLYERLYKKDIMRLHVPRVRCSQGVGLYALNKVSEDGLFITIPDPKKGIKYVTIPLYLYRKLYYDIVKDGAGNNKYVLNDKGVQLRTSRLMKDVDFKVNEISALVDYYKFDKDKYNLEVIRSYVLYDKIYRARLCPDITIPIDPIEDYALFSVSEYFRTNYTDEVDSAILMSAQVAHSCTYDSHPAFSDKLKLFENLDNMLDNHYICANNASEQRYIDNMRVKRHLSKEKFNKYVSCL